MHNSKNAILRILIGLVLVAIVVSSAVAASLFRAYVQQLSTTTEPAAISVIKEVTEESDRDVPVTAGQEEVLKQMEAMHTEGYAQPTSEQLQRMEEMDRETTDMTKEERRKLLEKMQDN